MTKATTQAAAAANAANEKKLRLRVREVVLQIGLKEAGTVLGASETALLRFLADFDVRRGTTAMLEANIAAAEKAAKAKA